MTMDFIAQNAKSKFGKDPKDLRVLSVGAGLGVVELPLIESGYRITLHEVQQDSLDYAIERARP